MRYRYDKETWLKKKSFDIVRFPEVLDFSEYLEAVPGQARKEELYDLTAVLVHSGTSAYSGHYMANVWNPELSRWTLLNDEQVVVFDKDSAFNPDAYTGFDGHPNGSKKPKTAPKSSRTDAEKKLQSLSTKNAYLLTYTRRKPSANIAKALPPPARVMEEVQKQNDTYEEELAKDEQKVKEMRAQFEAERSALRDIYQLWHVSSDQEPCYYVAASSLEQYIKYPENVPLPTETAIGMANSTISCAHGKLCPLSVTKAKRINKEAGLKLINDRMDIMAPILTDEDLCESCVSRIVQEMLYSTQHRKDTEEFERKNKSTKSAPAVWISKAWLNEWLKKSPKFRNEEGGTVQDDTSPSSDEYLSDVFCPHGNLSTDKAKRKLVNKSALEVLTRIFGQLNLPSEDSEECALCIIDQSAEMAIRQQLIDAASDENKTLAGLAMRGQRVPNRDVGDKFYAINKEFLQQWLNFVKRPSVTERPNTIDNSQLLCEHDGLLYDVLSDEEVQNSDAIALLRDEEWAFLSAIYGGGPEIFFLEPPSAEDGESTREIQVASHQVCRECRNARQLDYESAKITIRMMTKADYEAHNAPKSEEPPSVPTSAKDDGKDSSKKRSEPVLTYSRRSKRVKAKNTQAGKSNNIKVFMLDINKHDTVMDLKLKIMQKTNVVPLYQRLIWNKVDLDKNEATMGSLGILPQSSLDLIIFEESSDQLDFMQLEGK
ncbi:hypothetical protein BGW42_003281 [Actinomortierella wolfii]|nr:hypothetical protein BGW42_003281 [Actinomortierella wolfii]